MMAAGGEFNFVAVEILKGWDQGDPRPRWYLNLHGNDGSEVVMDDKLSHAAAMVAALEYGVPVRDLSKP